MTTKRILIVEDEDIVAADIKESLEHFGYMVLGRASTGESAIAQVREQQPDLVLMDIKLKGDLDGVSTAAILRESLGVPVIYLTAYADDATLERAKITEPYGYVLKPFKELELRTAIELALHKAGVHQVTHDDTPAVVSDEVQAIANILRSVDHFRSVDERTLISVASACKMEEYEANDSLVFEGDKPSNGLLVVEGRIAVVKSSLNGKELIVELLPPGDAFGLFAAMDRQPYAFSLRAQVRSRVLWVPQSKVMLILDSYPEINRRLLNEVFSRLRSAHDFSRALAHDLVEVRVASALCALIPRFCTTDEAEETYTVHMTRQELAEIIGSTPETVIRATKAMERSGLLDLTKSGVIKILDREALEDLAEQS